MKTILNLTVLGALACPIYAVDGVVLINQSNALAGNVTPGDAPGFPVTISAPGSYRLSGNLTVPDANTTAIEITAANNDVNIDLNGFSIIGPVSCRGTCSPSGSGDGIRGLIPLAGQAISRLSVFNGSIQGMGHDGINLASTASVEKVRVTSNGSNGIELPAFETFVYSCGAVGNGANGIIAGNVRDSVASGNAADGIQTGRTAIGNDASNNRGNGISGFGAIVNNSTVANSLAGITSSCPSTTVANFASSNAAGDIAVSGQGCTRANNSPAP
jgi:hypothetical protein